MSEAREVAAHARNLGKQYRSVLEIVAFLDEIGNLEQVRADAERDAQNARANMDAAVVHARDVGVALVSAEATLKHARSEAENVAKRAEISARAVLEKAEKKAARIVDSARGEADDISKQVEHDKADYATFMAEAADKEGEIQADIKVIEDELEELRKRIG